MKELTRMNRLIVATTIFVFIIIIGLLTFRMPDYEYKVPAGELVAELVNSPGTITADEALANAGVGNGRVVLVDLRNPYDFNRGTLENAINIPVSDILDEENMEYFRQLDEDSVTPVLFGENERVANGARMFLRQLGFKSFKVLEGGYGCLANKGVQEPSPACGGEEPILDYAAFMEALGGSGAAAADREPVTIQPVKRTKKTTTEGGC